VRNINSFSEGIFNFNSGRYFEAHDNFEELWMESTGAESEFFRGLIHTAVGCYHLRNGNYRGAKSQLLKSIERLSPFGTKHHGILLDTLRGEIERLLMYTEEILEGRIETKQNIVFPQLTVVDSRFDS
jgi:uncharacterized protein